MSIKKIRRVRRSPEASRDNILSAAEAILVEKGPQFLKLADVAAAAGVANATVLHHFGSIDEVQAALMERMVEQLVTQILSADAAGADLDSMRHGGLQTLFDAFERKGPARLAAWLELTDESKRLTAVRRAVDTVVARRLAHVGLSRAKAENLILVSVVLAMGVGLFGRSLSTLLGKPPQRARQLALDLLNANLMTLAS